MKILYCAFVRSHLEYASQVWNPKYNIYINRLEGIQRRFLRYTQYRSNCYLPNYVSRCKKFHILPLHERRRIADLAFLFNLVNGSVDVPELVSRIALRVPSVFLRRSHLLNVQIEKKAYRQNSFMLRACRTFNAACQDTELNLFTTSIRQLKKRLCCCFFE